MFVARKIAYNVLVNTVSKVFSTILALVAIGLITRYLGKDGFGEYATVLAFLSFFSAIADLGLYHLSTREISRQGADEEKIIGNIFSLRILSAVLVALLAPILVSFFPYSPELKKGIFIVALSFVFSSGYQVLNGVFQKNLAMDRVAGAEFLGKVVQISFIFWAVENDKGFSTIVSALLFSMMAIFALVFLLSRKYIKIKPRFDFFYWKKFLKEAFPIGMGAVIVFVYFKMDTILLSVMKESSDVGIYGAAYKVIENLIFFPAMISGLVFPIISKSIFTDKRAFQSISDKTFKVFVLLTVPLVVGGSFLSDGIISLIGGGEFVESGPVLRILIFALAAIFFANLFNNIIIAANMQKKLMLIWSLAAVINLILNFVFIPRYSYFASAYISVITEVFVATAGFFLIVKKIGYLPSLEKTPSIFLAGFFMGGYLFWVGDSPFFFSLISSFFLYSFLVWLFGGVKTAELSGLISK